MRDKFVALKLIRPSLWKVVKVALELFKFPNGETDCNG
jgi:hypothetical protein